MFPPLMGFSRWAFWANELYTYEALECFAKSWPGAGTLESLIGDRHDLRFS